MQRSNKRAFADVDINGPKGPSPKKTRQVPSVNDSRPSPAPSSPTLIGSIHSSPSSVAVSSQTSDLETASSETSTSGRSDGSASGSSSSSDESSDARNSRHLIRRGLLLSHSRGVALCRQLADSTTSSGSQPSSDSLTSTSASVSDNVSSSSASASEGESLDRTSSSGSSSSSSNDSEPMSRTIPAATQTLTAQNLSKLQLRLDSLMPKLQQANEQLDQLRDAGKLDERNIENVKDEDGRGYIEMNLGLGVLEEQRSNKDEDDEGTSESSSGSESESDNEAVDEDQPTQRQKKDAITRLLKASMKGKRKVQIEEVGR